MNESKIKRATPALDRAERDMVEVAARAETNRREIADFREMMDSIVRVSPALYAPFS